MFRIHTNIRTQFLLVTAILIFTAGSALAQQGSKPAAEAPAGDLMTYQGRLMVGGTPANGTYDFEFTVSDVAGNVLQTVPVLGVTVSNGIFTARIPLGLSTFTAGGGTFLGVGVRQLPTEPFTPLGPPQPITSTPYAFKAQRATLADTATTAANAQTATSAQTADLALNASNLGGIPATQYVLTTDPRLNQTGGNYIQNTTTPQTADFNISGTGTASLLTASTVNAQFQYSLNGLRLISTPGSGNLFAGYGSGTSNTTGASNVFIGKSAGNANTTANFNTFVGYEAGYSATSPENTFIGYQAGRAATTGVNTFVGSFSGYRTTTGASNSFFGTNSGSSNTTGGGNTFLGSFSGTFSSTGQGNVFVGERAGYQNVSGSGNVFVGSYAGEKNQLGSRNVFIGGNTGGFFTSTANDNVVIGYDAEVDPDASNSVAIGKGAKASLSNQIVLGTSSQNTLVSGKLGIGNVPTGGSSPLCLEPTNKIVSLCSSSIRFKDNVENFAGGLDVVKRLRPVSFTWKNGGMRDVGFVAEEVADVEPLLASRDEHGDVQGVKYDRITTALVNAVKEQQAQLDRQLSSIKGLQMLTQDQATELQLLKDANERQRLQIRGLQLSAQDQQVQIQLQKDELEALKKLVCGQNGSAPICKAEAKQ